MTCSTSLRLLPEEDILDDGDDDDDPDVSIPGDLWFRTLGVISIRRGPGTREMASYTRY